MCATTGGLGLVLVNEVAMLILLAVNVKIRHTTFLLIGILYLLTESVHVITGIRIPLETHSNQPAVNVINNSKRPCLVSRKRKSMPR